MSMTIALVASISARAHACDVELAAGHVLLQQVCARGVEAPIEHLARPDLYIAKLADRMRAGALIAVPTGDFASLNARSRRTKWRLMHPPSHAHYFSIASMTTMLDRFGFDGIYARHCGFYRSMAYGVFVQKHGDTRALDILNRLGVGGWPFNLNFCDIMYVIGRKR